MKRERKTIRILGKTYRVKWWGELPGTMGACQPDDLVIHISREFPEEEQITTVLHEGIEAYNNKLNLKIRHDSIEKLDTLLYAFLVDNGVSLRPLIEEKE